MKTFLTTNYNKFSKADKYIIGYVFNGNVFFVVVDDIAQYVKLDTVSGRSGYSLKLSLTNTVKNQLLKLNPTYLCNAQHFYKAVENSQYQYSKDDVFEKMVFAKFYKKWKKDNIPFYIAGDMKYKGVQYQIRFENAILTTEKQINRLLRTASE